MYDLNQGEMEGKEREDGLQESNQLTSVTVLKHQNFLTPLSKELLNSDIKLFQANSECSNKQHGVIIHYIKTCRQNPPKCKGQDDT